MHKILVLIGLLAVAAAARGADPMATDYSYAECRGSLSPYPAEVNPAVFPDSLEPVYINHVGRHGARFPASSANCIKLQKSLAKADSLGTITPSGRMLMRLNSLVMARGDGHWGALDSLGMAEQRAIASRLFYNFGEVFSKASGGGKVSAASSYSPRCMMSMYSFLHQLDRMDNRIEFVTTTGRSNSPLLRPFDVDSGYLEFRGEKLWKPAYEEYFRKMCPSAPARRLLGERFAFGARDEEQDFSLTAYYVVAGCAAMNVSADASDYFSQEEYNALWSCFNLRQYLQRTASTVSAVPAEVASDLLVDLISTTDSFISGGNPAVVNLRFGHAETLMPLLSLMRLKGCYYMTNYFDTVGLHWRDFEVVPMAANIQLILFKAKKSGRYYLRVDLNERPVPLMPGSSVIYTPWEEARMYLSRCLPLAKQI